MKKKESEDDYDSDLDDEYYPGPYIMDVDLDYDEYSDGEIPDEEIEMLKKEATIELNEEFIGKCQCDYVPPPSVKPMKKEKSNSTKVEKSDSDKNNSGEQQSEDASVSESKKETDKSGPTVEPTVEENVKEDDEKLKEKKDEISDDKKEDNPQDKNDQSPKSSPKRKGGKKKSK